MVFNLNFIQQTMASEKVLNLDDSNFESTIQDKNKPVLVDFWAPWCGPCKAIAPILDELANEMSETVTIGKLDVDVCPDIASKYNVRAIPTMIIFKDGQILEQIVGLANKADIKAKLSAHA